MNEIALSLFGSFSMLLIGIIGILSMRHPLITFLSIELLFNGANLLFVLFARLWGNEIGLAWVFFILLIAAIEAAIGLAILIHLQRNQGTTDLDAYQELGGAQ